MKHSHALFALLALALFAFPLFALAPESAQDAVIQGQVVSVQSAEHQFMLRANDGKEVRLQVDEHSMIQLRDGKAELSDLKKGTMLQVTYQPLRGENRVKQAMETPFSDSELKQSIRDTLGTTKDYSFAQKEEYLQQMNKLVNTFNVRIADLEKRAATADVKARQEMNKEIVELQKQRDRIQAEMPKLRAASMEAWGDLKQGVSKAASDFVNAYERALSHFREEKK